jgi:hypothetical protein
MEGFEKQARAFDGVEENAKLRQELFLDQSFEVNGERCELLVDDDQKCVKCFRETSGLRPITSPKPLAHMCNADTRTCTDLTQLTVSLANFWMNSVVRYILRSICTTRSLSLLSARDMLLGVVTLPRTRPTILRPFFLSNSAGLLAAKLL